MMQNKYTNSIQRKVINLLRPIAKSYPDQFIKGALDIWLRKSLLGKDVNHKRCYEKLFQILACVYQAKEKKDKP